MRRAEGANLGVHEAAGVGDVVTQEAVVDVAVGGLGWDLEVEAHEVLCKPAKRTRVPHPRN